MSKRPYPFDEETDSHTRQYKMYIGMKEMNNRDDELIVKIYKHTMQLLFKGATTAFKDSTNVSPEAATFSPTPAESVQAHQDKYKQTFLSNELSIHKKGEMKENVFNSCPDCRLQTNKSTYKCYFCDTMICLRCTFTCVKCSQRFCNKCSSKIYINSEELDVCLTCYCHT